MDINDVEVSDVARVYSGRPGCGCGCNGKYYDAPNKMVKRVLNKLKGLTEEERAPGKGRNRGLGYQDDGIFFYETEKRYYWIYLKEVK
jgi:hypothetical protein